MNHVQLQPALTKPSVICSASQDIFLCADDEMRAIFEINMNFDGVTIHGNAVKCISYPFAATTLQSVAVLENVTYFSAQGRLYRCSLETKTLELVVDNSTNNPASEVNKISVFGRNIVFKDPKDRQIKEYNPEKNAETVIVGSGQEKNSDGSEKSASFVQVHGICTYKKSLFVTDVAMGNIKLVTGLSETVSFLKTLDVFMTLEIRAKGTPAKKVTLREAKENVDKVCNEVQRTVASVKERFNLSRETNGPEGTVSKKTQDSLVLLRKGMNRLTENISSINSSFVDQVELSTLLTTQVENLHAVTHFKHETSSVLNYAQDFGTIVKESLKRTTKWAAKYYTHDKSYYPVPDTSMSLSAISTMSLPAVQTVTKEDEVVMRDWMENFRPVQQRTVRSETTKDKGGSLPPAVYSQPKLKGHSYVEFYREHATSDD